MIVVLIFSGSGFLSVKYSEPPPPVFSRQTVVKRTGHISLFESILVRRSEVPICRIW